MKTFRDDILKMGDDVVENKRYKELGVIGIEIAV